MLKIVEKIKKVPGTLVLEAFILIIGINTIFSGIYYQIYLNNKDSFINICDPKDNTTEIEYFDFFYFANTTWFCLGHYIMPQSKLPKIICMFHLVTSYLLLAIIISRILN